jgi:hypothetical protein
VLTNPSSEDTVFDLVTSNGTAVSPDDYTAVNETGLVIAAGQTSFMYSIPLVDDSLVDGDEYFTVSATVTSGNTSNINDSGNVTI